MRVMHLFLPGQSQGGDDVPGGGHAASRRTITRRTETLVGHSFRRETGMGRSRQYREALRINPKSAEAHDYLGRTLLSQGDVDGAVAEFHEALAIDPTYGNAHYFLGEAHRAARQGSGRGRGTGGGAAAVASVGGAALTPTRRLCKPFARRKAFRPTARISGDRRGSLRTSPVAFFVDNRPGASTMNIPKSRLEKRAAGIGDFLRRDFLSRDFLSKDFLSRRRPEKRREPPMTISAACICEGVGQSIILAISDRMITYGDTEIEPEQPKITADHTRIVCLFAGHRDFHQMIVSATKRSADADGVKAVAEAAELYASHYVALGEGAGAEIPSASGPDYRNVLVEAARNWPPNWSHHSRGECWTRRWG